MQHPHHFPPQNLPAVLQQQNKSFLCGPIGAPEIDLSKCLHDLFREQAQKTPNNVACVEPETNRQLTYKELDELSDQLSNFIISNYTHGELEHTIGLYMNKSVEYVVGYIAILKSGAAYIPIELVHPRDMLEKLLEGAQPVLVLTKHDVKDNLPSFVKYFEMNHEDNGRVWKQQVAQSDVPERVKVTPDNLAYLVFSSGTTGLPKAITCPHRGAVNSYCWRYKEFPFDEGDRVACNIFFVWELLRPMLRGATLYIIPDNVIYNPKAVVDYLSKHKIARVLFTPSLLQAIIDSHEPEELNKSLASSLKIVWMCGEVLTMKLNQRFKLGLPNTRVLNLYSVSECHDVSGADVADLQSDTDYASAGFMLDNVQIYILDENLNLVDKGEIGELYVGGVTNAREYLHQPQLTAEKFVPNPFLEKPLVGNDNRLYRTGDIARILPDNSLEIRGRCNSMVKIRGYSVELCAIEAVLSAHEDVEAAIVIPEGEDLLTKKIVAYIIGKSGHTLDGQVLREYLKTKLPHYMIPQTIMHIEEFPLNAASGKIDKKQLPTTFDHPELALKLNNYKEPETDMERSLLNMFYAIFGEQEKIGTLDSFLDLGGNSFQMAKLYSMITKEFEHAASVITLPEMYNHPTVADIASILAVGNSANKIDLYEELQQVINSTYLEVKKSGTDTTGEPKNIFLTGVTGFLGAYLLRDCLEIHSTSTIHCLVRASTTKDGLERIRQQLVSFNLWKEDYASRVGVIVGNLELEHFGLTPSSFINLANSTDLIIHNGAIVDFNKTYQSLKPSNVQGTRTVLLLSCAATCSVPIYHVSTNGVFPLLHTKSKHFIREMHIPTHSDLKNGYSQSKWVAERLMIHARELGLPVVIFRPGDIVGDSITGQSNKNHDLVRLLKGMVQMKIAPRDNRLLDMIPVDFVSKAIVAHNQQAVTKNSHFIFNLVHPEPVRFNDIVHSLKYDLGYNQLQVVDGNEWIQILKRTDDVNPVVPLWPFLSQIMNHDDNLYDSSVFQVGTVPSFRELLRVMAKKLVQSGELERPSANPLFGKCAVITGASSGIGRAIATQLAIKGVNLVLGSRNVDKLKQLKSELQEQQSASVEYRSTDVTVRQQVKDLVQHAETHFGAVDILINNAGIMPVTLMKNCKEDLWEKCVDVNIKGVLNGIGAVLPSMLKRNTGDIVTISSNAGREVWDCLAVYSGSKFAVEAICKGLRKEIYGTGLRVIQVQPGDVETDLWNHDQDDQEAVDKLKPVLAEKILEPVDIASMVVYSLSQPLHVGVHEVLIEPQGKSS